MTVLETCTDDQLLHALMTWRRARAASGGREMETREITYGRGTERCSPARYVVVPVGSKCLDDVLLATHEKSEADLVTAAYRLMGDLIAAELVRRRGYHREYQT